MTIKYFLILSKIKFNEKKKKEEVWKWFKEAVKEMYTFRITGGEPLLRKHTNKVIDYLRENQQPELH